MAILTKDDILKANDLKTKEVAVPEWGGEVFVRTLTGRERDAFESSILIGSGKNQRVNMTNLRAKLCSMTMVDADGNQLFQPADIKDLADKSSAALQRVFEVAMELSGLTDDAVDELTKN